MPRRSGGCSGSDGRGSAEDSSRPLRIESIPLLCILPSCCVSSPRLDPQYPPQLACALAAEFAPARIVSYFMAATESPAWPDTRGNLAIIPTPKEPHAAIAEGQGSCGLLAIRDLSARHQR